jgi:hypothetical protein
VEIDHSTRYHAMDDWLATEDLLSQAVEDKAYQSMFNGFPASAVLTKDDVL